MHKITPSPAFRILELGDKSNKYEIPAGNTEALIKVLGPSPTLAKSNDGNWMDAMLKKKAINTNSEKKNCLDHRSLLFVERIRLDDKIETSSIADSIKLVILPLAMVVPKSRP